jgi:hypothetical protein
MRLRFSPVFCLALTIGATSVAGRSAAAQETSLAPAPAVAVIQPETTPVVGPTLDAARAGVRHAEAPVAAAPARRGGYGQPVALMVVGGAAVLTGLIIGGGAGSAIAVGGAIVGLVGLYQYLQ